MKLVHMHCKFSSAFSPGFGFQEIYGDEVTIKHGTTASNFRSIDRITLRAKFCPEIDLTQFRFRDTLIKDAQCISVFQ